MDAFYTACQFGILDGVRSCTDDSLFNEGLYIAAKYNEVAVAEILLQNPKTHFIRPHDTSIIDWAMEIQHYTLIQMMFSNVLGNSDLDLTWQDNYILYVAIKLDYSDTVRQLLMKPEINPLIRPKKANTNILEDAVNNFEIIELLLNDNRIKASESDLLKLKQKTLFMAVSKLIDRYLSFKIEDRKQQIKSIVTKHNFEYINIEDGQSVTKIHSLLVNSLSNEATTEIEFLYYGYFFDKILFRISEQQYYFKAIEHYKKAMQLGNKVAEKYYNQLLDSPCTAALQENIKLMQIQATQIEQDIDIMKSELNKLNAEIKLKSKQVHIRHLVENHKGKYVTIDNPQSMDKIYGLYNDEKVEKPSNKIECLYFGFYYKNIKINNELALENYSKVANYCFGI